MLNQISLSGIDPNLLVLLPPVLEEVVVARSRRRLNITPSAVSHSLGRRLRHLFNDPLFLRTPEGVVPHGAGTQSGEPVADILARVGRVMASAAPFDAATTQRQPLSSSALPMGSWPR